VDNAYLEDGASPFTDEGAHPAEQFLDRIEEIAIRYGGDVMTEIRHLLAKVKSVL
jgi:FAD/FMN-containing dehydrogenase